MLIPTLLAAFYWATPVSLPAASELIVEVHPLAAAKKIAPEDWLVLPAVDGTGRRPFRPDRVFARYLLDRASAPPQEGEEIRGENQTGMWSAYASGISGVVAPGFKIGWAYTAVEVPKAGVYMAKLTGGSRLFVGGAGFAGDVYGYGFGGVPVALEEGTNHVFISGLRGNPKLTFERVEKNQLIAATWDALLPDLLRGEPADSSLELPVFNASTQPLNGGVWSAEELPDENEGGGSIALTPVSGSLPSVVPLAPFSLRLPVQSKGVLTSLSAPNLELTLRGAWADDSPTSEKPVASKEPLESAANFAMAAREKGETHNVVFPSAIDGSLQEYGLVERDGNLSTEGLAPSLVLSLHGASVPAMNQARAYGRKGDFWIAAALNRRPFGFDWQDWGREDAYEALAHALIQTGVDDEHVFLTGHSMGGHGTWHLGANDPDRFLAIAPSAGWSSFDSYGGRPAGALDFIWRAADGTSLTLDLINNLAQIPTFVLHGTADDNVPAHEAELIMAKRAESAHADKAELRSHFEEGAGHWWGNKCVDWPAIFDMFTEIAKDLPLDAYRPQPDRLRFRTVDPAVDSEHHWVEVLQPLIYGEPVEVFGEWDAAKRILTVSAPSAGALILRAPNGGRPIEWVVGGSSFAGAATQKTLHIVRNKVGDWIEARPQPGEKSANFSGPFKRAFDNNFVLVFGTIGDSAENKELLERARYDLERWSYRAAGEVQLLSDAEFQRRLSKGSPALETCNVILYGNSDSNAAWDSVFDGGEIEVGANHARIGQTDFEGGDLLLLVVRPRLDAPASSNALVGAFASTGIAGARLGYEVPVFVSGVGLPDWTLISTGILGSNEPLEIEAGQTGGDAGVLSAGWFNKSWQLADTLFQVSK